MSDWPQSCWDTAIVTGIVTLGRPRGRLLGLPTANLESPPEKMLPADGIYAVEAGAPGINTAR